MMHELTPADSASTEELIRLRAECGALRAELARRDEAQARLEELARFPIRNPNPVLRLGADGRVLSANPASDPLLAEWAADAGADPAERRAPEPWRQAISGALAGSGPVTLYLGTAGTGQRYAFTAVPDAQAGCVDLYGTDVTELHISQEHLENARQELEVRNRDLQRLLAKVESQRALLDTIIENLPVGIGIAEVPSGRLVRINEQTRRIWRLPSMHAGDARGYGKYVGFHPDGRPYAADDWQLVRALRGETIHGEELAFVRGDGSCGFMRSNAAPVRDAAGNVVAAMVVIDDITERKEAEAQREAALGALHDSQERLRLAAQAAEERAAELDAVFAVMPHSLIVFEPDGRIRRSNKAAAALYGFTPEYEQTPVAERLATREYCAADGRRLSLEETPLGRVLRGETVHNATIGLRLTPGVPPTWLSVSAAPLRGPDGEIVGAVSASTDITALTTARARLEEAYRELELRAAKMRTAEEDAEQRAAELDAVFETIDDGMMIYGPRAEIVRANAEARRILSLTPDDERLPLAERVRTRRFTWADGRPVTTEDLPVSRALKGEAVHNEVMAAYLPGQSAPLWLLVGAAPLREAERPDRIFGAIISLSDITELHVAQERLQRANAELEGERARLEAVVRQMPAGVFIAEAPAGRIVLMNRQAEEIVRGPYRPAEAPGAYLQYQGFYPDGRPYTSEELPLARTMLSGERVTDEEIHFVRGDGSRGVMLASSSPVVDHEGQLTGAVLTFHDITGRKEMEDELRAARDELERRVEERTAALSVANQELHAREKEARRQAERAEALAAVAARLSAFLDLDGVLQAVCEETARVLRVPAVSGAVYRDEGEAFESVFHLNLPEAFVARVRPRPRAYFDDVLRRVGPILAVEDTRAAGDMPNAALLAEYDVRSLVGCTILLEGRPLGGLTLYVFGETRRFTADELALLRGLADQAALAIGNAKLYAQLREARDELERRVQERTRELGTVLDLSSHITSNLALEPMLAVFANLLRTLVDYTSLSIYRLEDDELAVVEYRGLADRAEALQVRIGVDEAPVLAEALATRQPVVVSDAAHYEALLDAWQTSPSPRARLVVGPAESQLALPLMVRDKLVGVVRLSHDEPNRFSARDADLALAFANHAAVAMENARLYEQAKELAVVQERQRLARDLHDIVSQTLFSAGLTADVLPKEYARDPEYGQRLLDDLRRMTRGAMAELRALLVELRPQALLEADLGALLTPLAEAAAGRSDTQVEVVRGAPCAVPAEVQVAMYRIAQEALHNVAKHARAAHATVSLECAAGPNGQAARVELRIEDDGIGFDPERVPANQFGLSIMRERAAAIGAALSIDSRPGAGTRVAAVWAAQTA